MAEKIWTLLIEFDNEQARYANQLNDTANKLFGELFDDLHYTEQDEVRDELISVLLFEENN